MNVRKFFLLIFVVFSMFFIFNFFNGNWPKRGYFLDEKISPNNIREIQIYEYAGNATGGYWTRIYLKDYFFTMDKLIYLKRSPYKDLSISWVDDDNIKINDINLDLSNGDKYIHPEIQ